MKKRDGQLETDMEALYSFARLHSWCSQLEDKIQLFFEATSEGDGSALSAFIDAYPVTVKGDGVLSTVLREKLGEDRVATMSRCYTSLKGKIDIKQPYLVR